MRGLIVGIAHVVQDQKQTLSIYPQAKTYRQWVKDSPLVKKRVQELKAAAAAQKKQA